MPFLFFFLVIALPLLEIASIIEVGRWIGVMPTLALLVLQGCLGVLLIQSQSFTVGEKVRNALREGTPPEKPLLDAAMINFAGILFLVPGFVTDIFALAMLVPAARRLLWKLVSIGFRTRHSATVKRQWPPPPKRDKEEDIIDVEFTEVPPEKAGEGGSQNRGGSPWHKGD